MIYTFLISADLRGFWPLNEHYKGRDLSVYQNHAILHNMNLRIWNEPNKYYRSYTFRLDKLSYVQIRKSPALLVNTSFTYLFMTIPSDRTGPLLNYNDEGEQFGGRRIWFFPTWNTLHLTGVGHKFQVELPNLKHNKWHFVGFSYDKGAKKLYAWMDGEIVANWTDLSSTGNFDRGTDGDIFLGILKSNNTTRAGASACLFVYADALCVTEVKFSKDRCTQSVGKSIRAGVCRPYVETELTATKKSATDGN